jgi:hypothetical protein
MSDPVQDFYNPPAAGTDFEEIYFSEVEDDDLFWLTQVNNDSNSPHKKTGNNTGVNMRNGAALNFKNHDKVYQKS